MAARGLRARHPDDIPILWRIDNHSRSVHLGLNLLPAARGKGYGTDVVAVLCHYGFVVRGLHRLQVETLADKSRCCAPPSATASHGKASLSTG